MPFRETRTGLARALSKLGYCSRAQAAELICAGRVRLNGAVRRDPETAVVLSRDSIDVDGHEIRPAAKVYFMLNKPRGVVTTASDERGRETVYDYLPATALPSRGSSANPDHGPTALRARQPEDSRWLAPVGRLDKASEGLLLLTNDSAWAARVTSPQGHVDKTYHVQINALADRALLEKLSRGVRGEGREVLGVKSAEILRQGEKNSWLVIVLDEGKNRQIRRIFDALGIEVLRLLRVAFGNLQLGGLPKGKCRPLTAGDLRAITSPRHS